MTQQPGNGKGASSDLTAAVLLATSGLRRDVQGLLDRLDAGELYTPLARELKGVPEGEEVELTDSLTLVPHMLVDAEGHLFCALFTRPEFMEPLGAQLDWNTDGGPLQYVAFSARTALDMTLGVIDDEQVLGVVINAGDSSELMLRRSEVGSLLHGKAIPLVGYVADIASGDSEQTIEAESDAEAHAELRRLISECLAPLPAVTGFELKRTFNPERDTEPHLTLRLATSDATLDRAELVATILDRIREKLPPPGYIDILFDE